MDIVSGGVVHNFLFNNQASVKICMYVLYCPSKNDTSTAQSICAYCRDEEGLGSRKG